MLSVVGGFLARWLGGGTLIAVLALGGGWLWENWQSGRLESALQTMTGDLDDMRTNRNHWRDAAAAFEQQALRLAQERQAARAAVQALRVTLKKREGDYAALLERIKNSPEDDDGPVAPVLQQTLEALP